MRRRTMVIGVVLTLVAGAATSAQAVTGWHVTTLPHPGANARYQIRSLNAVVALGGNNVWAGGSYHNMSAGITVPTLLHWTGAWHVASIPTVSGGGDVRFLAASGPSDVWAVGNGGSAAPHIFVFHNNGTGWRRAVSAGLATGFAVFSVAAAGANNLWLGGYDTSGTVPNAVLEHWDGAHWTRILLPVPARSNGQVSGLAFAPGAGRPTAVGYTVHNGVVHPYAARFAGGRWRYQTAAATSGQFNSVVMLSATNGWAAGTQFPNQTSFEALIGHWNGTSWTTSTGRGRTGSNTLLGISAGGPRNVWAVGYSMCSRCQYRTLAEHWNGSRWAIAATANPSTTGTDAFFADAVVPGTNQTWAVGTEGPARPANGAEFFLAERDN